MPNGDFEMNRPGDYTVQNYQLNDFINGKNSAEDLAKFGKTYSVQFAGNAETFLWTTKSEPERGKSYYGHIQSTSGKMLRFKLDKQDENQRSFGGEEVRATNGPSPGPYGGQDKDDSIARAVALKASVEYHATGDVSVDTVLDTANSFVAWLQGKTPAQAKPDTVHNPDEEPLNIPEEWN